MHSYMHSCMRRWGGGPYPSRPAAHDGARSRAWQARWLLSTRPLSVPQDNLILGAVVAACTLFILVYWWNK